MVNTGDKTVAQRSVLREELTQSLGFTNDSEKYPAGDYPFQHPGGAGLPEWTKANRNIENEDVVLWYVFGTNHIPRTEDWPVMPVEKTGFHLKPSGFFARSPGIDVAPSKPSCH